MFGIFKQLFENHEKGYIDRLKKCSPPCLPWIGTHLTNIYRKHEFNKLNVENHKKQILVEVKSQMEKFQLAVQTSATDETSSSVVEEKKPENNADLINFSKYRLLIEFVNDLLQYQNVK